MNQHTCLECRREVFILSMINKTSQHQLTRSTVIRMGGFGVWAQANVAQLLRHVLDPWIITDLWDCDMMRHKCQLKMQIETDRLKVPGAQIRMRDCEQSCSLVVPPVAPLAAILHK